MLDFDYLVPTKVLFGKGRVVELGEEIKKYASRILLVYGSEHLKRSGLYDKIVDILAASEIKHKELSGVRSNPTITKVREGVKICKDEKLEFILAVGGGSVIESAKAIAAGAKYEGDSWDFYSEGIPIENALPLGTVLTLAAAGSEMNGIAVIRNEEKQEKLSIDSDWLRPKVSILDPTYTFTVPRPQTAAGVVDIFCHILEQYFSSVEDTFLQDRLAESLFKTCM
jgi:alcohol dehydrogenase YqhD (iron-dependent ADH family)